MNGISFIAIKFILIKKNDDNLMLKIFFHKSIMGNHSLFGKLISKSISLLGMTHFIQSEEDQVLAL